MRHTYPHVGHPHHPTHEKDGGDDLRVEDQGTINATTTDVLAPDGVGGLTWVASITLPVGNLLVTTRITAGPYTLLATDRVLYVDTDGGDIVVNLPAGTDGRTYKVVNVGSSGNDVTLTPDGAELLNGANASETLFDAEHLNLTYETTEGWW